METVIISACLVGDKVRYDGRGKYNPLVKEILQKYNLLPFCPEVEGGLSIPRVSSEIKNGEVFNKEGKNVTRNFLEGAKKGAMVADYSHVRKAILQERSPSCGVHQIHDGEFKGNLIDGKGIFTQKLIDKGIEVYTIEEFYDKFIKENEAIKNED